MPQLLSLDAAKADLKVDGNISDADIAFKIGIATGLVLEHIKNPTPDWTAETAPAHVTTAILLAVRILFDDPNADPLSPVVLRLLEGLRNPTLA